MKTKKIGEIMKTKKQLRKIMFFLSTVALMTLSSNVMAIQFGQSGREDHRTPSYESRTPQLETMVHRQQPKFLMDGVYEGKTRKKGPTYQIYIASQVEGIRSSNNSYQQSREKSYTTFALIISEKSEEAKIYEVNMVGNGTNESHWVPLYQSNSYYLAAEGRDDDHLAFLGNIRGSEKRKTLELTPENSDCLGSSRMEFKQKSNGKKWINLPDYLKVGHRFFVFYNTKKPEERLDGNIYSGETYSSHGTFLLGNRTEFLAPLRRKSASMTTASGRISELEIDSVLVALQKGKSENYELYFIKMPSGYSGCWFDYRCVNGIRDEK